MNLKKKITIVLFFITLFIVFPLFLCQCKKNIPPPVAEHTFSINSNTVFLQNISHNSANEIEKKIAIIVFVEEDEDIEKIKSVLNDFVSNEYKLVFLVADWLSIFHSYISSPNTNSDINSICNFLNNALPQDKKFVLLPGKLGCFSLCKEVQSDCIEGLVLLSPYCDPNNYDIIKNNLLNIPTFISVGENDKNSYNFSLQLYEKNHSFCEMRTYPTDDTNFILLESFAHVKEQIKLWIETIMTRKN
ncbi:MAG: hypothetical protein ACP5UA_03985 [Candidatus Hydrogenedens sp.]